MDFVISLFSSGSSSLRPVQFITFLMRSPPKRCISSSSRATKNWLLPGVALASGAAPQLVVHPARLVMLRANDMKPAQRNYPVMFLLPVGPARVPAAQHYVRAPSGHIGGHGHRARPPGLGHNGRLLGMVARVQHLVRHAPSPQPAR